MRRKTIVVGSVLGLVSPSVGVFLGLQVSTTLGNVFAFPFVAVAYISGVPMGMWPSWLLVLAVLLSIALWIFMVYLITVLMHAHKEEV